MSEASQEFVDRLQQLSLGLLLSIFCNALAWRKGYYQISQSEKNQNVYFSDVLKAFILFIFLMSAGMPLFTWVFSKTALKDLHSWLNLFVILFTFSCFAFYFLLQRKELKEAIIGQTDHWIKHIGMGMVTWLICYPLVVVVNQTIELLTLTFYGPTEFEQVAVHYLKMTLENPLLLILMSVVIVFLVPILEELLFRGFLQCWLKSYLSKTWAIVVTSVIFALFHYSSSQGINNIELIVSLFILSCYLGFIRERENSLLASIALHSTFNLISVFGIILGLDQ